MTEAGVFSSGQSSSAQPNVQVADTASKRRLLRIWMVDDHAPLREGFAQLLNDQPDLKVTRQFDSLQPLFAALAEERPPDVLLLDLHIGEENGLTAIVPVKKLAPTVKVMMLTTFNNMDAESEARRAGAAGFLLKIYEPDEISDLISQAFHNPEEPRLFPNLNRESWMRTTRNPILAAAPGSPERPGFFAALRQLWKATRRQATD